MQILNIVENRFNYTQSHFIYIHLHLHLLAHKWGITDDVVNKTKLKLILTNKSGYCDTFFRIIMITIN